MWIHEYFSLYLEEMPCMCEVSDEVYKNIQFRILFFKEDSRECSCTSYASNIHIKDSVCVYFLSDDAHFSTNPKIPGIDLSSVRMFFATLGTPAFSALLEQVLTRAFYVLHCGT